MKLNVDKEGDALYLRLDDSPIVESEEVSPGVVLDYSASNEVIGIEMLHLSTRTSALDFYKQSESIGKTMTKDEELPEFNLFNVLEIWQRERQHSEFISWLLTPGNSHGIGDSFLRAFIKLITIKGRKLLRVNQLRTLIPDAQTIRRWKFQDLAVETESNRIDISLIDETDRFVCFIENKMFSTEHSNQLSRYLKEVQTRHKNFTLLPVFLTPSGIRPRNPRDAGQYIPMGYREIMTLLQSTLNDSPDMDPDITSFIRQYIRALEKYVLVASEFLSMPITVLDFNNYYDGLRGASKQYQLNEILLSREHWDTGKQLMSEVKKANHNFSEAWVAGALFNYREWQRINF